MDVQELARAPLFEGMTDDEIAKSAEAFQPVRVLMGDRLTDQDDYGYSFFVVLAGQFEVRSGDEVVARLGPGDHFGEVSLVNGTKRNATVRAVEGGRVAKIMTWNFQELLAEHPVLAERIRAAAEQRST